MSAHFHLDAVGKTYGDMQALQDVNLRIEQGEQIALIGPSGSGKTTLLKALNAQVTIDSGTLSVHGTSISELSHKSLKKLRAGIAYIPQDLGLVQNLKVYQNVLLGKVGQHSTPKLLKQFVLPPKAEMERIHDLLGRVGIPEKLYAETSTLSGGQRQRVAVARSLYQQAHTILADEPISAVDPARARSLVQLLLDISAEHNLTLIMSMHNIALAQEFFPRLIGLKAGKVFLDSTSTTDEKLTELYKLTEQQLSE